MSDPGRLIDPTLPAEIADAMEAVGLSPKLATLMNIISEFQELKRTMASAEPAGEMWPLMKLLPVDVDYQKALRAANSEQLGAEKIGGRWFCTKRAMVDWLAKIGQSRR